MPIFNLDPEMKSQKLAEKIKKLQEEKAELDKNLETEKQKLNLRDSYAKIISADNEDDRHDARMEYLSKRNQLDALNF